MRIKSLFLISAFSKTIVTEPPHFPQNTFAKIFSCAHWGIIFQRFAACGVKESAGWIGIIILSYYLFLESISGILLKFFNFTFWILNRSPLAPIVRIQNIFFFFFIQNLPHFLFYKVYVTFVGKIWSFYCILSQSIMANLCLSPRPRPYGRVERSAYKVDFSASPLFLSSTEDTGASVEMTVSLLCRVISFSMATSCNKTGYRIKNSDFWLLSSVFFIGELNHSPACHTSFSSGKSKWRPEPRRKSTCSCNSWWASISGSEQA